MVVGILGNAYKVHEKKSPRLARTNHPSCGDLKVRWDAKAAIKGELFSLNSRGAANDQLSGGFNFHPYLGNIFQMG